MEKSKVSNSSLFADCSIKERSVNFTREEVYRFQLLVEKYKHILLCKKTDATSSKQKEQAWSNVVKDFNSVGETPRSIKQLKYKFENMKRIAKKEATKERQELLRTGGGKPPQVPPSVAEDTDWLRSIMSGSIDGNESIYDDDVLPNRSEPELKLKIKNIKEVSSQQKVFLEPDLDDTINIAAEDCDMFHAEKNEEVDLSKRDVTIENNIAFDCSTPHSSLRKPIAPPLRRQLQKKPGENSLKKALQEQKLSVIKDLNDLEREKLTLNIKHLKELHEQMLRHNEEKHRLEIMKLNMEIDLIKAKNLNQKDEKKRKQTVTVTNKQYSLK